MPCEDWATFLKTKRVDIGEEIKLPEPTTWAQIAPALPLVELTVRYENFCVTQQWCFCRPRNGSNECQQSKGWVASADDWADTCKWMRPKRVVHVPPAPGCVLVRVLNGMFGVPKKGKMVEGTNLPMLRLIINAIPSKAFLRTIEANIRALPYHGQWWGIEVDQDDRAIVWSESDKTALLVSFQQLRSLFLDPWPRHLIPLLQMSLWKIQLFVSCLWAGRAPAVCSINFNRRLCFLPPPLGAGLDGPQQRDSARHAARSELLRQRFPTLPPPFMQLGTTGAPQDSSANEL